MDYVEGPMIGAELELCAIRHVKGPCAAAESLARASLATFGPDLNWTPAADALYLRYVLELYAADHNPEWYDLARRNADDALQHARSADGLFFKQMGRRLVPGPAAAARRRDPEPLRVARRRSRAAAAG